MGIMMDHSAIICSFSSVCFSPPLHHELDKTKEYSIIEVAWECKMLVFSQILALQFVIEYKF